MEKEVFPLREDEIKNRYYLFMDSATRTPVKFL